MNNFLGIGLINNVMKKPVYFALFIVLSFSLVSGQSLSSPAWKDTPSYFQDAEVDVRFSDVIEEKESYQRCTEYENRTEDGLPYGDCLSYTTDYRGGQNTYIFGIENIDYWYVGNGNVHLEFDVVRNDLTKELHTTTKDGSFKPGNNKDSFIEYFNGNYLFRDRTIDSTSAETLLSYTKDIGVSSLGDSLRAKNLESKNLMASSNSRVETVIKLDDFRNGGAVLNDAVTVEVVS